MQQEDSSREQLLEEVERLRQRVSLMEASASRRGTTGEAVTDKDTKQAPPDTGNTGRSSGRKDKRALAEQALVAEQNFRNSLDNSPLGVIILTEEEEVVYANQSLLGIYGHDSLEELRNTPGRSVSRRRAMPHTWTGSTGGRRGNRCPDVMK